jgi:hypothetical protein
VKLLSKGHHRDAQRVIWGDVLDRQSPEPELITFGNRRREEYPLLTVTEAKRTRHRVVNHNFEISSFLKIGSDARFHHLALQFFYFIIFSILPGRENSVPYSCPVMNVPFDFEVA